MSGRTLSNVRLPGTSTNRRCRRKGLLLQHIHLQEVIHRRAPIHHTLERTRHQAVAGLPQATTGRHRAHHPQDIMVRLRVGLQAILHLAIRLQAKDRQATTHSSHLLDIMVRRPALVDHPMAGQATTLRRASMVAHHRVQHLRVRIRTSRQVHMAAIPILNKPLLEAIRMPGLIHETRMRSQTVETLRARLVAPRLLAHRSRVRLIRVITGRAKRVDSEHRVPMAERLTVDMPSPHHLLTHHTQIRTTAHMALHLSTMVGGLLQRLAVRTESATGHIEVAQ